MLNFSRLIPLTFVVLLLLLLFSSILVLSYNTPQKQQQAMAIERNSESTKEQSSPIGNQTDFHSAFDTYIIPDSLNGYGVYEKHESNVFAQGETLFLYIEPVGFGYSPITNTNNETLYLMNFTWDMLLSNKQGDILGSTEDHLEVISYHKNKEVFLTPHISQTQPFPEGDYVVKYTVTDETSKKSFEIVKDIKITKDANTAFAPNN
jgi:hypothetical protein